VKKDYEREVRKPGFRLDLKSCESGGGGYQPKAIKNVEEGSQSGTVLKLEAPAGSSGERVSEKTSEAQRAKNMCRAGGRWRARVGIKKRGDYELVS